MNEPEQEQDWDSGPFCRHWSDCDCEEVCANCGHRCTAHSYGDDETDCLEDDCDCQAWVESE